MMKSMARIAARRSFGVSRGWMRGFSASAEEIAKNEAMASQIVDYAASFRKKGVAGYSDAMQFLEHGLSFLKGGAASDALCKVQFSIAKLHTDNGKLSEAAEVLESAASNSSASLEVRVCAKESLVGIHLQLLEDELAALQAQSILDVVSSQENASASLQNRAAAATGLVNLAKANYEAAASCFGKLRQQNGEASFGRGIWTLAHAEFCHLTGKNVEAQALYKDAIEFAKTDELSRKLSAPTMTAEEVEAAGMAGLGQLLTELGKFTDAEKQLTEALHKAEDISGDSHTRVGMVLACMANLYSQKAKAEDTGFMLAEGLYRRSLDLLKAPALDKELKDDKLQFMDVIALTRARYGDILSLAKQREREGSLTKSWASKVWNCRRPITELLSQDSHSIVDLRFGRIL